MNILQWFPAVKTALRGIIFRPGWYGDHHDKLERLYRNMDDPWNFEHSTYERERYEILLETIRRYPHRSVLEVGCAEGLFTCRLASVAERIVGIDVSATAIERARVRCERAEYHRSSLAEFAAEERFDLVVCAETLYYIKDVNQALQKLSTLGNTCLVSYLERESKTLDGYLQEMPLIEFKRYKIETGIFTRSVIVAVWRSNGHAS